MTVKVVVAAANNSNKDYELNREQPLRSQVASLCSLFNITANVPEYTLQFNTSGVYISDEDLASPEYVIPPNCLLNLKLKPDVASDIALKALKDSDSNAKKKALFGLRDTLKDEEFAKKFLTKNGVEAITVLVDELTGNTLAYALSALQTAMSYDFAWQFNNSFVEKILLLTGNPNPNVVKSSLRILCRMCESPKYGFAAVSAACKSSAKNANKQPYASLILLLASTDVDIQLSTLTLINTLTNHAAAGAERNTFLQLLDSQEINTILKRQLIFITTDPDFKKQLYTFQKHKLALYKGTRSIAYDKNNTDHEALLMRLWSATYPDTKLDSRVSEQWKLLGFQGTDPATDFRGMGLLGLEQLVYFAENHNDIFRKIVNGQIARKEREYPVAVAGINITQKLYEILKVNDEGSDGTIFPILFSHRHAFEEMYCTTFQVLDHTWDDMNASYMDFPKVIAAVHKQIVEVIDARPLTLEQFHIAACFKGQSMSMGEPDIEEPESVKKLRITIKKEVLEMVKQQKLAFLTDGSCFRVLKGQGKDKREKTQNFFYVKVNDNHSELAWAPVTDVNEKPASLPNVVKVSEIVSVVVGADVPSFNKKKPSEDIVSLAFAFLCKDEKLNIEFLAINRDDYVNWVDGMKALLGKVMDCPETSEEGKTLVSLEMKVRLLDLEGIEIPKDPPPVPEIPSDFDFVELRDKRLSSQISADTPA